MISPGSGLLWICFAPDLVSLRKTQFDETEKTGKSAYTQTCLESAYVKTAPSSSPNPSDYKQIKYTVSMDYSCSFIYWNTFLSLLDFLYQPIHTIIIPTIMTVVLTGESGENKQDTIIPVPAPVKKSTRPPDIIIPRNNTHSKAIISLHSIYRYAKILWQVLFSVNRKLTEWPDRDVFSDGGRVWSAKNNPCGTKEQDGDESNRLK